MLLTILRKMIVCASIKFIMVDGLKENAGKDLDECEIERLKNLIVGNNGDRRDCFVIYDGIKYRVTAKKESVFLICNASSMEGIGKNFSFGYWSEKERLTIVGKDKSTDKSFIKAFLQGYQFVSK